MSTDHAKAADLRWAEHIRSIKARIKSGDIVAVRRAARTKDVPLFLRGKARKLP